MDICGLCELAVQLGCEVKNNEPLSLHTSFNVGGECEAFIDICSGTALKELISAAGDNGIRFYVLGNGSNVIFDSKGYNGVIFHIGRLLSDIRFDETSSEEEFRVYAEAGAGLNRLCTFALDNSLTGLEFAYGIPGSVGGAIFMNAGAYGGEIKDILCAAVVFDINTCEIRRISDDDFSLGYRHTSFMDKEQIILGGVFSLKKGDKEDIKAKMTDLMGRRKDKQPLEYPSAGSTFKRPEGKFAGKLIQDSSLRGLSVGGAQVSEKHCGFVINKGNATSDDIMTLIKHIQDIVFDKTGTKLECEVRFVPFEE